MTEPDRTTVTNTFDNVEEFLTYLDSLDEPEGGRCPNCCAWRGSHNPSRQNGFGCSACTTE